MERFVNMAIDEEGDQDGCGNDHAQQDRPDAERAQQQHGTEDEIEGLEDDHRPEGPASKGP